ncbi:hypothetical protein [Pseudoalteromonas arabiensis]|uniref:hypothetical protein n=1 Tax=Pseudoalteromonas arabiensis TaxID=874454 RepID=UPI00078603D0|nr:hypothetical protein [Pseudoalteromonas arabiensis]
MFSKMRLAKKSILIFFLMPLSSWATCDATIESIQQGVDNLSGYHSLQRTDAEKQLTLYTTATDDCTLYVALSSENNFQFIGQHQHIPYHIASSSSLLSGQVSRLAVEDGQASFALTIAAGTPVKAGQYRDRLTLQLMNENNEVLDDYELNVDVNIPANVSLSLLGFSSSHNVVNLGELVANKEYAMLPTLKVVTNADVAIKVDSENKGKLIHTLYQSRFAIDYSLIMNGRNIDLKQRSVKTFSFSDQTVFLLPLKIKLAQFQNQAAGHYSDTVRFQISPLNY